MHAVPQLLARALWFCCLAATVAAQPANDSRKVKPPTSSGQFVFQLAPNSLTRNPRVDMTVYGEVTDAGKALPLPSPQHPQFYLAQSGRYKEGALAPAGEKIPDAETVTRHVKNALKTAGYLDSPEGHAPDIVVVYTWGSKFERFEGDNERHGLAEYRLVGGSAFAEEINDVFQRDRAERENLRNTPIELRQAMRSMMPLERYKRDDDGNAQLVDQVRGDFYFIILSAYSYSEMLQQKRTLLWRTHLTVNSQGVSLHDTIGVLVGSGAAYLGKETGRPGSISKTVVRRGRVEIGAPQKVEVEERTATPPQPAVPRP